GGEGGGGGGWGGWGVRGGGGGGSGVGGVGGPGRGTVFPYTTLFRSQREHPHRAHRLAQRVLDLVAWDGRIDGEIRVPARAHTDRSEEHTSELQSRVDLVCRLLLEKKKAGSTCSSRITKTNTDSLCVD